MLFDRERPASSWGYSRFQTVSLSQGIYTFTEAVVSVRQHLTRLPRQSVSDYGFYRVIIAGIEMTGLTEATYHVLYGPAQLRN